MVKELGFGRILFLFLGVVSCGPLMAGESIAVDRVRQRTPWNGLVDIDYTVAGVTGDPSDYQVEFTVSAGGRTFVASNFWDAAWCDHATANGPQRATWNARADGIAAQTPVSVTARLVYAPVTDASAEFAIVDLSSGPNSDHYPVRYVVGDTNRTELFNIDVYKTKKLVLKKVHAGEFWMGEGDVSEGTARHRVRLTKDYFMGIFEVTRRQYWCVLPEGSGQVDASKEFHPWGPGNIDCMPINSVSYDIIRSADGFLARLNARAKCRGKQVNVFSLPTEAQWEYMPRAGAETKYFCGNTTNELAAYASMKFKYGKDSNGYPVPATTPDMEYSEANYPWRIQVVGSYLSNPWGFYDVYGNMAEWCSDKYGNYPAYSEEEVTVNPTGPEVSSSVVNRGGCFWDGDGYCSSGGRKDESSDGSAANGFQNRWGARWGFRVSCGLK